MEPAERLKALHIIQKDIGHLFNRGNAEVQFAQNASDSLIALSSLAINFAPPGPMGMVITFLVNHWVKARLLPSFGHWRTRRAAKNLSKEINHKLNQWWIALAEVSWSAEERIQLCAELSRVFEKISSQEDLDTEIQKVANFFITQTMSMTLTHEITKLVKTVEQLKLEDFTLLQQNLHEIEIIINKVAKKEFSADTPLFYELDEDDEMEGAKPYRKIYAFKDNTRDYAAEIRELEQEADRVKAQLKAAIEYNTQYLRETKEKKEASDTKASETSKTILFSAAATAHSQEDAALAQTRKEGEPSVIHETYWTDEHTPSAPLLSALDASAKPKVMM